MSSSAASSSPRPSWPAPRRCPARRSSRSTPSSPARAASAHPLEHRRRVAPPGPHLRQRQRHHPPGRPPLRALPGAARRPRTRPDPPRDADAVGRPPRHAAHRPAHARDPGGTLRIVDGVDISDPDLVGPAELGVWSRFPGARRPDRPARRCSPTRATASSSPPPCAPTPASARRRPTRPSRRRC